MEFQLLYILLQAAQDSGVGAGGIIGGGAGAGGVTGLLSYFGGRWLDQRNQLSPEDVRKELEARYDKKFEDHVELIEKAKNSKSAAITTLTEKLEQKVSRSQYDKEYGWLKDQMKEGDERIEGKLDGLITEFSKLNEWLRDNYKNN